ncbi:MAG TPA: hypothetical protein VKV26_25695 [Dehalococcoidia bacterium]|nr:hypothetical protein [Dehalococcoidia bacterium]
MLPPVPESPSRPALLSRRRVLGHALWSGVGVGAAVVLGRGATARAQSPQMPAGSGVTAAQLAFRNAMRKLWEDHITWTRLFIVSAAGSLPDLQATTDRLLRNQDDIGDAIKPFYGDTAGGELTGLLKDHILTAADLLTAAIAGGDAALSDAKTRWYANADAIAAFLNGANPANWPLADMQTMMHDHLDHTLAEAVAHLQGDYAADIAAYDAVHLQILEMADMLSLGIIAQFPDSFA